MSWLILVICLSILGMGVMAYRNSETLRREKEFAETLIRESADGIFAFDASLRFTEWNRAMEILTEVPKEKAIGAVAHELFPIVLKNGTYETYLKTLRGITTHIEEKEFRRPNGHLGYYEATWTPVRPRGSQAVGGLCVVRDVTERKLREELVISQQERLIHSARMKVLGEMAAGIAHEINTPVSTIVLKANELKAYSSRNPEAATHVLPIAQKVGQTAQRIGEIIRGLKAFASEPLGEQPFQDTTIRSVLQDVLSLCESRFKSHAVELEVECERDIPIRCRPVQIVQVLLNLMNNSFDAVLSQPERKISLRIHEEPRMVHIQVLDNGPGVPTEFLPRLMHPFATTKEQGKGTGLGLSISKGIVESHWGSLAYEPIENRTCFSIWLPKQQA